MPPVILGDTLTPHPAFLVNNYRSLEVGRHVLTVFRNGDNGELQKTFIGRTFKTKGFKVQWIDESIIVRPDQFRIDKDKGHFLYIQ